MHPNLVTGLIWTNREDPSQAVLIKSVRYDEVVYGIREKNVSGPDNIPQRGEFTESADPVPPFVFEDRFAYAPGLNPVHELDEAKSYLGEAGEILLGNMNVDPGDAEVMLNLYTKVLLREASLRAVQRLRESGHVDAVKTVVDEITLGELTPEEIEQLGG